MAYVQHPFEEFDVDELKLDLSNYRITRSVDDQHAAMRFLLATEDVLDVADNILRTGYFDNEVPIVVRSPEGPVVLEGNRRVTALKVLNNPDLVPSFKNRIESLRRRRADELEALPTRIRALVVPTRETARERVARMHTGIPKKRWSADQQANYYYDLLTEFSFAELRDLFPKEALPKLIRRAAARRFIAAVRYDDPRLAKFAAGETVEGRTLTVAAFAYAYERKDIAAAIGLTFTPEGQITPGDVAPEVLGRQLDGVPRRALERLLLKFLDEGYDTRTLAFKEREGKEARAELITELLADDSPTASRSPLGDDTRHERGDGVEAEPAAGGPAGGESRDSAGAGSGRGAGVGDREEGGRGSRGPNSTDSRKGLDLRGVPYDAEWVRSNLRDRYIELRRIDLELTPVAAALMLRLVLESTIKFHFRGSEHVVAGMKLSECVGVLRKVHGGNKHLANAINTLHSGSGQQVGSGTWFNLVSHSEDMAVSASDVRQAFKKIQSLLAFCLKPYVPSA